tara:strand:+ start:4711 stop:5637 length:927 start_codon:yes stop_codon:yes gene_type:complete
MNIILPRLSILIFTIFLISLDLKSEIRNKIIIKVGNSLITSIDIQNEIITNLVISKKEINQKNINDGKQFAIKSLINKEIKNIEINKYKIENFDNEELQKYIIKTANNFSTNKEGLKKIFLDYKINYDSFIEKFKTELLWRTLIYTIYQNQTTVNILEVDNELKKLINLETIEYNLSEIEISKSQYNENKLNEILKMIKNKGFDITAKKFSVAVTAKNGGLIGWVSKKSLSKEYLNKLEGVKIKDLTIPILSGDSITILKVNDIKDDSKIDPKKLKQKITNKKKQEKLSLFSRSHFSNLENIITIKFQ